MGRFLNKPLNIPSNVEIKLEDNKVIAKGKQGENSFVVPSGVRIIFENQILKFDLENKEVKKSLIGLSYRKVQNIMIGVNENFKKVLEINGIGYRWNIKNNKLQMQIGFSHIVEYVIPESVQLSIKDNTLSVIGIDKQQVGKVADQTR
jgi:large subunit ribosomal protein L6